MTCPAVNPTSSRICVCTSHPATTIAGVMYLVQMSRSLMDFLFIIIIFVDAVDVARQARCDNCHSIQFLHSRRKHACGRSFQVNIQSRRNQRLITRIATNLTMQLDHHIGLSNDYSRFPVRRRPALRQEGQPSSIHSSITVRDHRTSEPNLTGAGIRPASASR